MKHLRHTTKKLVTTALIGLSLAGALTVTAPPDASALPMTRTYAKYECRVGGGTWQYMGNSQYQCTYSDGGSTYWNFRENWVADCYPTEVSGIQCESYDF
jgi:hypothetical protein